MRSYLESGMLPLRKDFINSLYLTSIYQTGMPVKRQLLEPPYKAVGERLKAAREGAGLTQQELAAKVELSQKQISVLEGGLQLPMAGKLPTIVRVVGGSVDWLLTGSGKAPRGYVKPVEPIEDELTGHMGHRPATTPAATKKKGRRA